jgi:hypothetical protein
MRVRPNPLTLFTKGDRSTMNTPLPTPNNPTVRPRRGRWAQWLAATSVAAVLAACGGGGSSSADGTTSTGLSMGTVTGFGSIIVDGVRYDDRNVRVSIDTESGAPDASSTAVEVKLGHHVELTFTGGESNSSAGTVMVSAEIVGKVSAVTPELVVAGQTVKVNTDPAVGPVTVFEGYTSAADISLGDRVEVHGTPTGAKTVQATRIERKPMADRWLRVAGNITGLSADGSTFGIGGLTIKVDATTRIVPARATLSEGLRVVVWSDTAGTASTGETVTATWLRVKRHQETMPDARVSGAVTDCTPPCEANFKVGGISVDASNATFVNGAKADLVNGRWVALRGTLDAATNKLVATRVVFHKLDRLHEEVKLRGAITDFVDMTSFKVRGVPVTTDGTTTIGASCTSPLANGTLVALSGSISGFKVLAKAIECFVSPDGFILDGKGKVLTLNPTTRTFTLDGPLFAHLTLTWNDTTRFADGKTAADLAVGAELEVNGVVSGATVAVTRIEFEDAVTNPIPGTPIFETQGVASNVVFAGDTLDSFTVNGLAFKTSAATVVIAHDGAPANGVKLKVLFTKTSAGNIALLVRTDR